MSKTKKMKFPAEPHWTPLVPEDGLFLIAAEGAVGVAHFAAQFAGAWCRVPMWARRRMKRHWRKGHSIPCPMITMTPALLSLTHLRAFASVRGCGQVLRFQTVTARMPANVLQDLIAHELAHVCLHAEGVDHEKFDTLTIEELADCTAEDWGFSVESIDDWAGQDGLPEFEGLPQVDRFEMPESDLD